MYWYWVKIYWYLDRIYWSTHWFEPAWIVIRIYFMSILIKSRKMCFSSIFFKINFKWYLTWYPMIQLYPKIWRYFTSNCAKNWNHLEFHHFNDICYSETDNFWMSSFSEFKHVTQLCHKSSHDISSQNLIWDHKLVVDETFQFSL